ncbi:class I SAM-dependent methyltransferase [Patescibacteria group bacterium]|nr:class I SAM-dependent methyltransferase [Patescibacteria group bacterium]
MSLQDDAKRWDTIHEKVHKHKGVGKESVYAQEKEALFPRASLIIELGGGTGEDALYFLQKGHSVVVLDISEFALKIAQEKAQKAGFEKQIVTKMVDFGLHQLPIKNDSVNVAYSRLSLNYFDSAHTVKLFRDIYNMLKPGGKAYLTFKSPQDTAEMEHLERTATLFEPNVYIENGQLRSRFTIEQLRKLLANASIANCEVSLYKEKLEGEEEGQQSILLLNEVVFSKS